MALIVLFFVSVFALDQLRRADPRHLPGWLRWFRERFVLPLVDLMFPKDR
jgi:hypothetical protein